MAYDRPSPEVIVLVMLLLAGARAQMMEHGFEAPASMRLFERTRITMGAGRVKDGDCDAALKLAMADLRERANGEKEEVLVAVWPHNGRRDWTTVEPEVECVQKGKKTVVEVDGLVARQGTGAAYPEITPSRALEILDVVYGGVAVPGLMLTQLRIVDVDGKAYLSMPQAEVKGSADDRDQRHAARAINSAFVPSLGRYAAVLQRVEELAGIELSVVVVVESPGDRPDEKHRITLQVPRGVLMRYDRGNLRERGLVEASKLQYAPPGRDPAPLQIPAEWIDQTKR